MHSLPRQSQMPRQRARIPENDRSYHPDCGCRRLNALKYYLARSLPSAFTDVFLSSKASYWKGHLRPARNGASLANLL